MENLSKETREEILQTIRQETAKHLGQIQDTIFTSFMNHLQDEIRKDLLADEPIGLGEKLKGTDQPEKREEIEIDASGCENVVVRCYEPSPEELKIMIGEKVDAKIDVEKVDEPADE